MNNIREYIINNLLKWEYDENNPANITRSQGLINRKGVMNQAPANTTPTDIP